MAQALNRALRDAWPRTRGAGVRRGRRPARRRLPGHRRPTAEFGEDRCFDTPLAESGIVGIGRRHGDERHAAGGRDAVRRVRLPGVRADRQPRRRRCATAPAGGSPLPMVIRVPVRRRHRRRRAPLRLLGGVLRAHARACTCVAPGDAGRRVRAAARGDRLPRPGRLPRAQEALLDQGGGRLPAAAPAIGRGRGAPRGHRRHADRLRRRPCPSRSRRPRSPPRRAAACRWSTCARSCRSTTRPSCAAVRSHRPGRGRRRGRRVRRRLRGDRRPGHRALLPLPGRADPPGRRVRHPVPAAEARALPAARRGPHPRRRRRPAVGGQS